MLSGKSVGQAVVHGTVVGVATTTAAYFVGGALTTIGAVPIVVGVVSVLIGVGIGLGYDNNILGIKDFTEDIGQAIDDVGKSVSNFVGNMFSSWF